MNRPWLIWSSFGGCLALLLAVLGWLSLTTLRQERAQLLAERQAAFEEKVRLALWRMDSALTPLIVQESSRPFFAYDNPGRSPFPINNPQWFSDATNVLLHFQYDPSEGLTSPQVIPAPAAHPSSALSADRLDTLRRTINPEELMLRCAATLPPATPAPQAIAPAPVQVPGKRAAEIIGKVQIEQQLRNQMELNARAQSYAQAASNFAPPEEQVAHGVVRPVWIGEELVLARRVSAGGRDSIQGAWLDWAQLRESMLSAIGDLLPQASLEPIPSDLVDPQGRRLASLPVRLNPGPVSWQPSELSSPVRQALYIAWPSLLLAGAAVGLLLYGAISLSERRGAFVSAVTHELRTPLTTFRMYSEMLAEEMVTEPEKRREYLKTLNREAGRLQHLVENVLAYARLERGSARRHIERLSVGELLQRFQPRLDERAAQAGLMVQVAASEETRQARLRTDPTAIEQIVFNLVDNACKYAAPAASSPNLQIEATADEQSLYLRIRDHGPGIARDVARRLFRPFSKTDQEAAQSAPGVGLGLSLCRRLSRSLGGDLTLESGAESGARFLLRLPLRNDG